MTNLSCSVEKVTADRSLLGSINRNDNIRGIRATQSATNQTKSSEIIASNHQAILANISPSALREENFHINSRNLSSFPLFLSVSKRSAESAHEIMENDSHIMNIPIDIDVIQNQNA